MFWLFKLLAKPRWLYFILSVTLLLVTPKIFIFFEYVDKIYYSNNPSLKRPHERLRDELADMYQELVLLPGTVLIESDAHIGRYKGTGTIYYTFSTELSLQEVTDYYDKEFKNKGWTFKGIAIEKDWGGDPIDGVEEFRYIRGKYSAFIRYDKDKQEGNKKHFLICFEYHMGNAY